MKKKKRSKYSDSVVGYAFISPQLLLFLIFIIYPLLEGIRLSFYEVTNTRKYWVGLGNYADILKSELFHKALWNTVLLVFWVTLFSVCLGFLISAVISAKRSWFITFIRGAYYLPTIMSMMVLSQIWRWMLSPSMGIANYLLESAGLAPVNFLGDTRYVLPLIIFMACMISVGQAVIIYSAAMLGVDMAIYEAADIDGAGKWQKMFLITRPLVSDTTGYLIVINIITAMRLFVVIDMMTAGGPYYASTNLMYLLYSAAFKAFDSGYASAIGVIMFIFVIICSVFYVRSIRRTRV